MASTTLFDVKKSDSCANCFASAQFHLRNPFGVYYSNFYDSEYTRQYFGWHDKPTQTPTNNCHEFMTSDNNVTLDHDALFRELARV